jgi:hypothetical protein
MQIPRWAAALAAAALLGCSNSAPSIDPLTDQTAFVDREFSLGLHGTDEDDDELTFSFAADNPAVASRSSLTPSGSDRALFRWTPLYVDLGTHTFDFRVSDGTDETQQTVAIKVALSGEGSTSPIFVQPLGTGTTLNLEQQQCLDVPIVVEDPDSPNVVIAQEQPIIEGSSLEQQSELSAGWSWCPTAQQIDANDRYTLVMSADDLENARTLKNYLIVLRAGNKQDCPGEAPVVTHTPQDVSSVVDLTITAQVSDDLGIKYEPLFYYSLQPPGSPPDVGQMTQLTMVKLDGDMSSGTWAADVPNPVASQPAGSSAQLYYVIVAQDNDDAEGNCDHWTQVPTDGAFQITVTNPGGSGGLGLCASCSADAQCGASGDNCIYLDGGHHCFKGCSGDTECPDGYYCSLSEFTSIDGAAARQCIPNDYKCDSTTGCADDGFEENDSQQAADAQGAISSGSYSGLVICPGFPDGDDEDWYRIVAAEETQIDASIDGGTASDLDLALYDSNGSLVVKSDGLSSQEAILRCVSPGVYYLRVYAWTGAENSYDMTVALSSMSCGGGCSDDSSEEDDSAGQARDVALGSAAYTSTTNAICAWDDDWYEVLLFQGETIYATLTFDQQNSNEDLDLYIYHDGLNLTGCSETAPFACDPNNGQSGTSNERLQWNITQDDPYYIVVHGWEGSENLYDICIGLEPTDCP